MPVVVFKQNGQLRSQRVSQDDLASFLTWAQSKGDIEEVEAGIEFTDDQIATGFNLLAKLLEVLVAKGTIAPSDFTVKERAVYQKIKDLKDAR